MSINNTLESKQINKMRLLIQALLISGAINVGLVTTFIYSTLKERQEKITFDMPPPSLGGGAANHLVSNDDLLREFSKMQMPELVNLLEDKTPVENGYKTRDLALSCLNAFCFFNMDKAIGSEGIQKRAILLQTPEEVRELYVFPGLSEDQYAAIVHYAKTEKWPFTAEGIFLEVKKSPLPYDPSLLQAFFLTAEWNAVQTLFVHGGLPLPQEMIVEVLKQGDWQMLSALLNQQKISQDLSAVHLKETIALYAKKGSILAAKILLEWDRDFIIKNLQDDELISFLDLFITPSPSLETLLKEILQSPRSDLIWKKSASKLYAFSGMDLPEPYDHSLALETFLNIKTLKSKSLTQKLSVKETQSLKKKKTYTVQSGDNLWKIAKKHNISIESLMKKNRLSSEKLKPGKELEIP